MSSRRKRPKTGMKRGISNNAYGKGCLVEDTMKTMDNNVIAGNDIAKVQESPSATKWTDNADRYDEIRRFEEYDIKFKKNQSGMSVLKMIEKISRNKKNPPL